MKIQIETSEKTAMVPTLRLTPENAAEGFQVVELWKWMEFGKVPCKIFATEPPVLEFGLKQ